MKVYFGPCLPPSRAGIATRLGGRRRRLPLGPVRRLPRRCGAGCNTAQVLHALEVLVSVAAEAGLVLEPTKRSSRPDLTGLPPGFLRRDGAFELLGAAIGDVPYCCAHTLNTRVHKAAGCLEALTCLADPQTSLLLLRHCAAYATISYAMRVTPPGLHLEALVAFDSAVRACFEQIAGMALTPHAWRQAALSAVAGLVFDWPSSMRRLRAWVPPPAVPRPVRDWTAIMCQI